MSSPLQEIAGEPVTDNRTPEQVFNDRVDKLVAKMQEDATNRDRCLAEMYVFLSDFDTYMRNMVSAGGPMQMLKQLRKMGKEGDS